MKKCDICSDICFTQKHHIQSKSKKGSNKKFNLAQLCGKCHDSVHFGTIVIEGWFFTTNGWKLIWHHKEEESITGITPDVYLFKKKSSPS